MPGSAVAASPASRAARYLDRAQNADGGFGAAPGQASNQLHTGWTALGLASAGHNPRDVRRRGGRSIMAYLKRGSGSLRDIGELERTILVVSAAGLFPTDFAGRDLLRDLVRRRRDDGSYAGFTSYTAFGILAFRVDRGEGRQEDGATGSRRPRTRTVASASRRRPRATRT